MRKNSTRGQPLYSGQTGCPQYVRCSECFHCIHFNHLQDLQQVWGTGLDVISKVCIVLFIVGFRYYYFVYGNKMSERVKGWFTYDNTLSFPLVPYLTVTLELFTKYRLPPYNFDPYHQFSSSIFQNAASTEII